LLLAHALCFLYAWTPHFVPELEAVSFLFLGHLEPVEVEELVKVCAFNWWIVGIVDRFASKDFEC